MKIKRAFTLIELLVVIAIIGILSAVVLSSLSQARAKGSDARIKSQLGSLRSATDLYYTSNANSYGTAGAVCTANMFVSTTGTIANLITSLTSLSPTDCGSSPTAWSVASTYPSATGYWCSDSIGASRDKTAAGVAYTSLTGGAASAHAAVGSTVCQ
jgi:prepilin-type N-terminal cleavage/methylation domain-containing protein